MNKISNTTDEDKKQNLAHPHHSQGDYTHDGNIEENVTTPSKCTNSANISKTSSKENLPNMSGAYRTKGNYISIMK